MALLELMTYAGEFLLHGGEFVLAEGDTTPCCCPHTSSCCVANLSDKLCLTIETYDCFGGGVNGTRKITLTEFANILGGTKRAWEGTGEYSAAGETIRVRVAAICSPDNDEVSWYLCHDTCSNPDDMDDQTLCKIRTDDNPFLAGNQWTGMGITTNAQCLSVTYETTPIASCDNECSSRWTLADGECV